VKTFLKKGHCHFQKLNSPFPKNYYLSFFLSSKEKRIGVFISCSISVDGEIAWIPRRRYLHPSSVLLPCKHHVSWLGLLRSRPDPVHRSTIEQDKTSTSGKRLIRFGLTHSFKPTI